MPVHACYLSADWRKRGTRARTWYFHPFRHFQLEWKSRSGVADVCLYTLAAHVPAIDFFHPHHKTIRSCSLIRQCDPMYNRLMRAKLPMCWWSMMKNLCEKHWFFGSHSLRLDTEISSHNKTTKCRLTNLLRRHFSSISSRLPFSILQTANLREKKSEIKVKAASDFWCLAAKAKVTEHLIDIECRLEMLLTKTK